ncbi:MAG: hypothetical protein NVSMB69_10530 [Novosphingobium sp.]
MTDHFVLPDVRAFLDTLEANPRPVMTAEVLSMIRTLPPEMMAGMDLPVGDLATVRDLAMPGPNGVEIALRLFDPRTERGPGPVVVFYHGGGFIVGGIATHAGMAASIARGLDLPVVSVEYRLAPEHKWPAAPDDAEAAARWVAENGATLGREATGLIVCGDSAGGNLAIVTALALRDKPAAVPVTFQFAIYPGTSRAKGTASRLAFADGYGLESANMALYESHYAADPEHWRYAPLHADLTGLPPALVVTAALDPLRDEGRAYAAKLIEAGIPTAYHEAKGTIHGFASYRAQIPSAGAEFDRVLALAKTLVDAR